MRFRESSLNESKDVDKEDEENEDYNSSQFELIEMEELSKYTEN